MVWEVCDIFIDYKGGFTTWGLMKETDREMVRKRVRGIVRERLLGRGFWKVVAEQVERDGYNQGVFNYICQEWYRGDVVLAIKSIVELAKGDG